MGATDEEAELRWARANGAAAGLPSSTDRATVSSATSLRRSFLVLQRADGGCKRSHLLASRMLPCVS